MARAVGGGIGLDGRQKARLFVWLLALDLAALSQGEADRLRLLSQHMSAWLADPAGQVRLLRPARGPGSTPATDSGELQGLVSAPFHG